MAKIKLTNQRKHIVKCFNAFLKEQEIADKWRANMYKFHPPHMVPIKYRLLYCINPIYYKGLIFNETPISIGIINYSFAWKDTVEGHEFWSEKNKQWKEYWKMHRYEK